MDAKTSPTTPTTSSPACDSRSVDTLMDEISREESAKGELEKTAKNTPEKGNFRKLYDSEVAFGTALQTKLSRLAECGASPKVLALVKEKASKSRANADYLRESFPDFK